MFFSSLQGTLCQVQWQLGRKTRTQPQKLPNMAHKKPPSSAPPHPQSPGLRRLVWLGRSGQPCQRGVKLLLCDPKLRHGVQVGQPQVLVATSAPNKVYRALRAIFTKTFRAPPNTLSASAGTCTGEPNLWLCCPKQVEKGPSLIYSAWGTRATSMEKAALTKSRAQTNRGGKQQPPLLRSSAKS